ncbi:hypothetical protein NUW54_g8721 [Trametes sanguinea]|uniref:Uncharacterized protein n=1 Tax=Trametes sanguinea TaxID=158606 RepID=A0ACC1PB87_9APHY|nr:hypothetical protein NUW54_g8721 [Trametes sanguinea]
MSELEFFFGEQQAIMNMPEEDITDYLARRRRSRTNGSYSLDLDSIIVDSDTSISSYAGPSISHRRTTSVSQVSKLSSETPHHAETPQEHSRTSQRRGGPPAECSSVNKPSHAVVHADALVGSKRRANERELSLRMHKKLRREEEAINASADSTSQAPSHLTDAESNRSSREGSLDVPPAQSIYSVSAYEQSTQSCAPEDSAGMLVNTRRRAVSAESSSKEPTSVVVQTAYHGTISPGPAIRSSENCNFALPADPPTSHHKQGKQSAPSVPQTPREEEPAIPAPLAFHRRSTVADCSNITTPPSSGLVASVPDTSRAKSRPAASVRKGNGIATKGDSKKTVKAKGKGKKELITPLEYAERLQARFSEQAAKKKKRSDKPFLKGKRIFYYGGDLNYAGPQTRNRMDIITRHGGTLVPKYDPAEITHIVTDADERVFLRAIGLKKLSDIPQHIPTVKWSWVVSGFDRAPVRRSAEGNGKGKAPEKAVGKGPVSNVEDDEECEYPMDHEFEHAARRKG